MITFDPLWKTLKDKGISQYNLIENCEMSNNTKIRVPPFYNHLMNLC